MIRRGMASLSATKRAWLVCALLAVVTVSLYYPVRGHPFVNYDDPDYIINNPHIQAGLSWTTVQWALTTNRFTVWHPLSWLAHAVDYQLFGLNPAGHHEVNLLFHVLNVATLFWVLVKATGHVGRSAMVAALFAMHPINVECVAWIAELKNVLSVWFFLLALGAYRWYVNKPSVGRYASVAFLYMLSLLSKGQGITLPCVLLLWDCWPLRRMFAADPAASAGTAVPPSLPARSLSWLIVEKLPLFIIAALGAHITQWALRTSGIVAARWPLPIRIENAIIAYPWYLTKLFWPSHLAMFYPHPGGSIKGWHVVGALLLLMVITAAVLSQFRRRFVLVGWFWFVGTLVPMSGVVPIPADQGMADRYAYLPFIGLFLMICWTAAQWTEEWHISARALAVVGIAALIALAVVARIQLDYWKDNVTLWTHVAQVTRNNAVAETNIGAALLGDGRYKEAMLHFRAATVISPLDPVANLNIGFCEQKQGHLIEAIEQYGRVVAMTDRPMLKANALTNMGYAYRELGEPEKARESFAAAAALPKW